MIPTSFINAFQNHYGRTPTQADFDGFVSQQRDRREDQIFGREPSGSELAAQVGGAVAGLGGLYFGSKGLSKGLEGIGNLFGSSSTPTAVIPKPIIGVTGAEAALKTPALTVGQSGATAGTVAPASTAATSGTGSIGGATSGLGGALLPGAALGLGIAGTAAGLSNAFNKLEGGNEQQAAAQAINTGIQPLSGFTNSSTVQDALALSPANAAFLGPIGAAGLAALQFGDRIWGSGKDELQQQRDSLRTEMQELGLIDEDYTLNGVDLGKDGGFRFEDGRRIYELIPGMEDGAVIDGDIGEAAGALNPLGFLVSRGDDSTQGYVTGMLYNALTGGDRNDGVSSNEVRELYDQAGLDQATAFEGINILHQSGQLTEDEARAAQNAINQTFGVEYYSPEDPGTRADLVNSVAQRLFGAETPVVKQPTTFSIADDETRELYGL